MKYLTGVLVIAACLAPYCTWADEDTAAAAAAAAAGAASDDGAAAAVATAAVAASGSDSDGSAAAAAAAAASSTAVGSPRAHIPCICNKIYDPVCGSDGRTYSNGCVLRCISDDNIQHGLPGIRVISRGECRRYPCNCNNVLRPLCASDGNTYANECYFRCENARRFALGLRPLRIVNYGVCKWNFCRCPDTIIPVCGTDGRTYRNICVLQCVSRIEQSQGRPPIYWASSGPCGRERCVCPVFDNPLCGTDGKTYRNRCMLACENRKRDQLGLPAITIQYRGNCANCLCSPVYNPVCASNGVTFRNECVLRCTNIIRALLHLPPLTITSRGVCPCFCPLNVDPVCGTDEKTYSNRCLLNCENKRRLDLGLRPISIAHKGRCLCNCSYCDRSYAPLCGNDGRTYWNRCWLNCNKHCFCDSGRPLYAVHPGPC